MADTAATAERHSIADRMNRIPTSKHTMLIIFFVLTMSFSR